MHKRLEKPLLSETKNKLLINDPSCIEDVYLLDLVVKNSPRMDNIQALKEA